jgi:hypothetical protein
VYKIPDDERFFDFVEFNSLKDVGFDMKDGGLNVEAAVFFVYLT